jgi:hypothetical protein
VVISSIYASWSCRNRRLRQPAWSRWWSMTPYRSTRLVENVLARLLALCLWKCFCHCVIQ